MDSHLLTFYPCEEGFSLENLLLHHGKTKEDTSVPGIHSHTRKHIERYSHSLGLEIQLGLRRIAARICIRICIRIYVHVTLSYTISLGFAATSIKTLLSPFLLSRLTDLSFALNPWVLSRGNANCAEISDYADVYNIYLYVRVYTDYTVLLFFSSLSRIKPRAKSQ